MGPYYLHSTAFCGMVYVPVWKNKMKRREFEVEEESQERNFLDSYFTDS